MTRILVLYYSSWGHIETMAAAAAEGVREGGAEAIVKRVPETVPEAIQRQFHYKMNQPAPVAEPGELADYDGLMIGAPTRFGNMAGQMKNFLDQTGGLWMKGALVGKPAAVFTSTATQHGGQESTILATHTVLLHHGCVIVGLPYAFEGQMGVDEVMGNSPYGASTIAGGDGSRQPSARDLAGARFQGAHLARIAAKLRG